MTVSILRLVTLSDSEESLTHRILLNLNNRHILRHKDSSASPQNDRVDVGRRVRMTGLMFDASFSMTKPFLAARAK
ncbi:MAG: hypothetical protein WDA68_07960 [Phycisphaerae bacterium]